MTAKELRYIIFGNYYRLIGFTKENNYYSIKKDLLLLATKLIKRNI